MKKSKMQVFVLILVALVLVLAIVVAARSMARSRQGNKTGDSAYTAGSTQTEAAESKNAKDAQGTENIPTEIAGQYEITAMITKGEETPAEDLALLKSKGLDCTIDLHTDGTGVLVLFGEESDVTWDGNSITASGKTLPYSYEDGQLVVTNGDSSLTFLKK